MSSAFPRGTPSMTSQSTMSPSSLSPAKSAIVPPTCPAPTSAILLRAIKCLVLGIGPAASLGKETGRVLTRITFTRQGGCPCRSSREPGSAPAEFLHRPPGVPDFRHVPDFVPLKIHDIDVVCRRALAGRRAGATLAGMGGRENTVGAHTLSLVVRGERLHGIASVRHE